MVNGRPTWELKLVADILLAASLLAYMFGVLGREQFITIFMVVFNYIALNASQRTFYELKARVMKLGALRVEPMIKFAVIIFGILVAVAFFIYAIDYDTAIKALTLVATILAGNLFYLEYRLAKLSR